MSDSRKFGATLAAVLVLFAIVILSTGSRTQASVESSNASSSDARTTFDAKCAKCHGKDGRAKGLLSKAKGIRNLTDAKWQEDVTDERLLNSIYKGPGKMPAFKT